MRLKTIDDNIKGSFVSALAKYGIKLAEIDTFTGNTAQPTSLFGSIGLPNAPKIPQLNFGSSNIDIPNYNFNGGVGNVKVDRSKLSVTYPNGKTKVGGHRNWRNNNPGNLEYGKFAKAHGAIGTDGRFAIFPTMEAGYKAQAQLLRSKGYRNLSFRRAIAKYAPSFENDTGSYINDVARRAGINPNVTIGSLSNQQLMNVVKAMSIHEGMKAGKII